MNVQITELVGVIGGWSVILAGLSTWLGKVWSGRILQSENAAHNKEIENLKSELELERTREVRNSDAQFTLYSEVWSSLMDVKSVGDELWKRASRSNIENFIKALGNANISVNRGRLILKEQHYNQLRDILNEFTEYQVGKVRLHELRSSQELDEMLQMFPEEEIRHQIAHNRQCKESYESLLEEIVNEFRSQLGIRA